MSTAGVEVNESTGWSVNYGSVTVGQRNDSHPSPDMAPVIQRWGGIEPMVLKPLGEHRRERRHSKR